ncbi:hypothetical protein [Virgibacillus salinus]|uniref:Uncharacterized protein n=1 Tax=Virgibacillus salinus TaxID=553311 RepID=A0A1H0YQ64_9BACI|nr:hypothetical protein [Virgibacillus salinus]SDQ17305.1 hypothetical protein SAMN05216231_0788 [Virgibacillus salinus]
MSEIKCLVCGGEHFRKGYYDIDVNVDIYSTAYNNVRTMTNSFEYPVDIDVDVDTDIDYQTDTRAEINLMLVPEEKKSFIDRHSDVYKYACEDCGYIMTFTKVKNVKSKKEEHEQKQRENNYDWTDFGN